MYPQLKPVLTLAILSLMVFSSFAGQVGEAPFFEEEEDILTEAERPIITHQDAGARSINQLGWEWATKDQIAGFAYSRALSVDAAGNSFVAGIFSGGSLTLGNTMLYNQGGYDIYFGELDYLGEWKWGISFGGTGDDFIEDMVLDSNNVITLVGSTNSSSVSAGSTTIANTGGFDGFIANYQNSSGGWQSLVTVTGDGNENVTGVDVNSSGGLVISGWFDGSFAQVGLQNFTSNGGEDMFFAGISNSGVWSWSTHYGNSGDERANDIVWGPSNKFVAVGEFDSASLQFNSSTVSHGGGTGKDSIVLRSTDQAVEWVRKPIYTKEDKATHITIDSIGNTFVGGKYSTGNSMTWGAVTAGCYGGSFGFYVTKISTAGTVGWAQYYCSTYNNGYSQYHAELTSLNLSGSTLLVGSENTYSIRSYGSNYWSSCGNSNSNYMSTTILRLSASTANYNDCFTAYDTSVRGAVYQQQSSKMITILDRHGKSSSTNANADLITDSPAVMIVNSSSIGNNLQWQTSIGGAGKDVVFGLDVSATSGITTVGGMMQSHSLRMGNHILHGGDNPEGEGGAYFISRTDSNGNWLSGGTAPFAKKWTNSNNVDVDWYQGDLDVAPNGTVYMVGIYDQWIQFGSTKLTETYSYQTFLAIWDPLIGWTHAENLPLQYDSKPQIAVDSNGSVFVTGSCYSYGTFGTHNTGYGVRSCIAKRSTSGWDWVHKSGNSNCQILALESYPNHGAIFGAKSGCSFYGTSSSSSVFTFGGLIQVLDNGTYVNTWPIDSSGYQYFNPKSIAINSQSDVYVGGYFTNGVTFNSNIGIQSGGAEDGFLAKANSTGSWKWAISLGGNSKDEIIDIALLANNTIGVSGMKTGTISVGLNTLASNGRAFVAVATSAGGWAWASHLHNVGQNPGYSYARAIASAANGTLVVAGEISETTSAGLSTLTTSRGVDIFVAKMSADQDGDEITDNLDNCPSIYNNNQADLNADGIGDLCDPDDDGDLILDSNDSCPYGDIGWQSGALTDHDSDGCQDSSEDTDDDNDGLEDSNDQCPIGSTGWISSASTDHDADGCQDSGEDLDDDADSVLDSLDACPLGEIGWQSSAATDRDGDGCRDSGEDNDDDGDSILDVDDACAAGALNWTSGSASDNDGDGCQDISEDDNDDDDDFLDQDDYCASGVIRWPSGAVTDYDGDGCRDIDEDLDDDNDGVLDVNDNCPRSPLGWRTNPSVDFDEDGCHDFNEDWDDDGDGVNDLIDLCQITPLNSAVDETGCAEGDIQTVGSVGGDSGNSTTVINENHYHNNTTWVNNTFVNNTDQFNNQSYTNNSFLNESWENQTFIDNDFLNTTNLNTSVLNQNITNTTVNQTSPDNSTADLDEQIEGGGEMDWVLMGAGMFIVILISIVILQMQRQEKDIDWQNEDQFAQSEFEQKDPPASDFKDASPSAPPPKTPPSVPPTLQTTEQQEGEPGKEEGVTDASNQSGISNDSNSMDDDLVQSPPYELRGTKDDSGYEWVQWPENSGKNYFRSGDEEWKVWQQ